MRRTLRIWSLTFRCEMIPLWRVMSERQLELLCPHVFLLMLPSAKVFHHLSCLKAHPKTTLHQGLSYAIEPWNPTPPGLSAPVLFVQAELLYARHYQIQTYFRAIPSTGPASGIVQLKAQFPHNLREFWLCDKDRQVRNQRWKESNHR